MQKAIVYLLITALLASATINAQSYDVSLIPESLKKNADVVIRVYDTEVEIKSTSKVKVTTKKAVTVLNQNGQRYAAYIKEYSKFTSIDNLDGTLYDATGKKIKSVKKKEFSDWSDNDQSLMSDSRYKTYRFSYPQYPYTVEYEDVVVTDYTFFLPEWQPIMRDKIAVQQSRFIVNTNPDYVLRYKEFNLPDAVKKTNTTKQNVYEWAINNMPAVEYEEMQPAWDVVLPIVLLAPTKFELDNYNGDMTTWKGFGSFMNQLYQGRDKLPENIKQEIQQLTANTNDVKEKIKQVYEYLQKNTRYISVQLGVGGWQPYDAAYVAQKKYGDCKALSNYAVSLLKEAGVKAHPVIIKSEPGEPGLYEDFPAAYFNHVVVCVPGVNDTTWLECTSNTLGAGYMGISTSNKKAVMLTDEGGMVVSTPHYGMNDNLQIRKIEALVTAEGNVQIECNTQYTGIQQDNVHGLMHGANKEEQTKYLNNAIGLPTYDVLSHTYAEQKGRQPTVNERLKLNAHNYASITGKRLFITPNLLTKSGRKLSAEAQRKYDIDISLSFRDIDTVQLTLPQGYVVETMPKTINLQEKWGKYSVTYTYNKGILTMYRLEERIAGIYPPADYKAFAKYMEEIYKADRARMVLVKNNE